MMGTLTKKTEIVQDVFSFLGALALAVLLIPVVFGGIVLAVGLEALSICFEFCAQRVQALKSKFTTPTV